MTEPHPFRPRATVLIVNGQELAIRSFESILEPNGISVVRAYTGVQGLEKARWGRPDLVLVDQSLPDMDGTTLCRILRSDARLGASVPIVLTGSSHVTRQDRIAALRAGAWELFGQPVDAEEFLLRLDAYLGARLELDEIRSHALLDEPSGLYSREGLTRRARELSSQAYRRAGALACVVFGPAVNANTGQVSLSDESITRIVQRLATALKTSGRISDAIGRVSETEFAVFAPDTDAEQAILLAERLAAQVAAVRNNGGGTVGGGETSPLRAGFDAVPDFRRSPIEATELLDRATRALRVSQSRPGMEPNWLQPFTPTAGNPH